VEAEAEVEMELNRADLQTMDQLVSTWTGCPTTAVAWTWVSVPLTLSSAISAPVSQQCSVQSLHLPRCEVVVSVRQCDGKTIMCLSDVDQFRSDIVAVFALILWRSALHCAVTLCQGPSALQTCT
jgi:hypothetical protein